MHGLGNDFVVIDARPGRLRLAEADLRRIADRRFGIGCDQVIVLEPSAVSDAFMRIYNADGGEVAACGNASRCVGHILMDETGRASARFETLAGLLTAEAAPSGVAVDMGLPVFDWQGVPLAAPAADTLHVPSPPTARGLPESFAALSMGNPHALFFVSDVDALDLAALGPAIEHDPLFPERANVSLVEVRGPDRLRLRVWERGAGLTLACGTAACAAAVAAHGRGLAGRRVAVDLPGGTLQIELAADGRVLMAGAASTVCEGVFAPGFLTAGVAAGEVGTPVPSQRAGAAR